MERLTTKFQGCNQLCGYLDIACDFICKDNICHLGCPIQKAFDKLAHYETLEEQGLLLKLPCKVGDVVAIVLTIPSSGKLFIEQAEVKEINVGKYHIRKDIQVKVEPIARRGTSYKYYVSEWGKNIFSALKEAEEALRKKVE